MTSRRLLGAVLLAAGVLGTSCAVAPPPGSAYVSVRPPRAVVEFRTEAPAPGYVWIEGYHRWNGGAYEWVPGHWERVPPGGSQWVPGRWRSYHGQWYWVEGHWR